MYPKECPGGLWLVSGAPILASGLHRIAPSLIMVAAGVEDVLIHSALRTRVNRESFQIFRTTNMLQENL